MPSLTLREAVVAKLNSITALTNSVNTRIYYEDPSQLSIYPCVVVQIPDRGWDHNLDGADGVSTATVHIEAISQYESVTMACLEAVRNQLDGFRGYFTNSNTGVAVMTCLLQDEFDQTTPPLAGSDLWIYHMVHEYRLKHRVPFPTNASQTNV